MKKLILCISWITVACFSLMFCLFSLIKYSKVKDGSKFLSMQAKQLLPKTGYKFYAALPQVLGSFSQAIAKEDARAEILRQFLASYNSPIEAYAQKIVTESDVNAIDYRMITAIAMCESTLGKNMPAGSHNAWGYAIYTGEQSGAAFENWNEAIEVIAQYLASKYYRQGLTTPEEIGPIYAPPSVENGNSWAKCVGKFMDELR